MLIVLSPAKTLDFSTPVAVKKTSTPLFLPQAAQLIEQLRTLSTSAIAELMSISDKLAARTAEYIAYWQQEPSDSAQTKPAVFAFQGDVYQGLQVSTFRAADLDFAQQHLRILSGLYGLLRPLDRIQPYRLEMGARLSNPQGTTLYAFWGDTIRLAVEQQLRELEGRDLENTTLLNLASQEYSKVLQVQLMTATVISPIFKDWHKGRYKIISFYAKKARGLLAAEAIKQRWTTLEAIKAFNGGGYCYNEGMSTVDQWVFTRKPQ